MSRKKNDKFDARTLAEMLRGGYISICYVPSEDTVANRTARAVQGQDGPTTH